MALQSVLVTLVQAKAHCNVDHAADDTLIEQKIDIAESIVFDYLKNTGFVNGSPTVPLFVIGAILSMTAVLYRDREHPNVLSPEIKAMLHRFRDPALA